MKMNNYLQAFTEREKLPIEGEAPVVNAASIENETGQIKNRIGQLIGAIGLASILNGCRMLPAIPTSTDKTEAREAIFSDENPACWHDNRLGRRISGKWRLCNTTFTKKYYEMMREDRDIRDLSQFGEITENLHECGELPAKYDFPNQKTFLEARCLVNDTLDDVIYEGRDCKGKIEIKSRKHFGSLSFVPMAENKWENPFVPYDEPFGEIGKTTTTLSFPAGAQECRVSIVAEQELSVRVVE